MSHEHRTYAAIQWAMADCEGSLLDAIADLSPPRRKPLPRGLDVWDAASEACRRQESITRWESELAATWLYFTAWLQAYTYTRFAMGAESDADRREMFTAPEIQREIRREAARLLAEVMS